MLTVGMLQ